jgi:phosphatidylglycerol:prolipoprotein diacylglycerol transferase
MHPFLEIYGLKLPLYGIMSALGYAAGIWYCLKQKYKIGLSKDQVLDIIFYIILGALIGGKLFFIAFYWQDFINAAFVDKLRYGFVFLGGFAGACCTGIYILRKIKIPVLRGADYFVQVVPLGHAIGKIGCFLAGCCYGKVSHNFLAVKFSNPDSLVPQHLHNVPLYPVQLIEAAVSLILFFVLRHMFNKKHRDGSIIAAYMTGFGIIRFTAEFFRGEDEIYILGITQTQITAVFIILFAFAFLWWRKRFYAQK